MKSELFLYMRFQIYGKEFASGISYRCFVLPKTKSVCINQVAISTAQSTHIHTGAETLHDHSYEPAEGEDHVHNHPQAGNQA